MLSVVATLGVGFGEGRLVGALVEREPDLSNVGVGGAVGARVGAGVGANS